MLILDEPTNHLDVDAREALVQALNDYSGAVVVVSHDRHMLALTADRLVLVDGGTATEFAGSLEDYTDLILKGDGSPPKEGSKGNRKDERRAAAEAREQNRALRQAAQVAEKDVAKLEARKKELERAMFDPASATAADAALPMSQLMKRHADAVAALADAEARWLDASEAIEQSEAA
jgi:ATP-binding cassette subfamily F protein 3